MYKGIQEDRAVAQTNSPEAEKSETVQLEARLEAIAELIRTPKPRKVELSFLAYVQLWAARKLALTDILHQYK